MYRELNEETGLGENNIEVRYISDCWYEYRLPKRNIRKKTNGITVIGQRQKWFLLKFNDNPSLINLSSSSQQEFDSWKWVQPETTIKQVINFKRNVYEKVINEFIPFIR